MFPADKKFPVDFYVTVATVIPVLFLAIAVQGKTYQNMLDSSLESIRTFIFERFTYRKIFTYVSGICLMALAIGLVVYPAIAEVVSLLALGSGSDTLHERNWVMTGVVVLLLALVIPPLLIPIRELGKMLNEIRHEFRAPRRRKTAESEPASESDDANTEKTPLGSSTTERRPQ